MAEWPWPVAKYYIPLLILLCRCRHRMHRPSLMPFATAVAATAAGHQRRRRVEHTHKSGDYILILSLCTTRCHVILNNGYLNDTSTKVKFEKQGGQHIIFTFFPN